MLKKSVEALKSELTLSSDLACRNLWNLQALNYYDKAAFDLFSEIIVKNHTKLSEIDVANALSSLAHFKHVGTEAAVSCLESLIKVTIRHAKEYRM